MSDVQVAFLLAAIFLTGFFVWLARHNSLAAGICLIAAIAELCIGIIAWRKSKKDT